MLQTQHLHSQPGHYGGANYDTSPWSNNNHNSNNNNLNQAQAQAAAAAAAAQQQHYSRIAVNQNHAHSNNSQSRSANTQASTENTQNTTSSLTSMNDSSSPGGEAQLSDENRKVLQWVADLMEPTRRESALMELSKKREQVPELALVLWYSFGVMTSLLQEIISVYPLLNPSQLTAAASNRVCNALALLQCVASHNETRGLFLNGK